VLAHDVVGGPTGMGRVVAGMAGAIVARGWRLTVVAGDVTTPIGGPWSWHRVPVRRSLPPLLRYWLWAAEAARAIGSLSADLVHVHSPALLGVADLMTCHHLAQAAHDHGVRPPPRAGLEGALRATEAGVNRRIDDRRYRRRPPAVHLSFVSPFLLQEFTRLYGSSTGGWVLPPPAPAWRPVTYSERSAARQRWQVPGDRLVVGYLGGDDHRKGIADVARLAGTGDVFVLAAGHGTDKLAWSGGRGLGFVDPNTVLEASDVIVAPALFDAAPVAVLEAVARGIPAVVGKATGWAEPLARAGAGVVWNGGELLGAVRQATGCDRDACRRFSEEFSAAALRRRLWDCYTEVFSQRPRGGRGPSAEGSVSR
jgi:glycosyltransferase involved in cell wall biosynthesis